MKKIINGVVEEGYWFGGGFVVLSKRVIYYQEEDDTWLPCGIKIEKDHIWIDTPRRFCHYCQRVEPRGCRYCGCAPGDLHYHSV